LHSEINAYIFHYMYRIAQAKPFPLSSSLLLAGLLLRP
jgi:hypothetical protein